MDFQGRSASEIIRARACEEACDMNKCSSLVHLTTSDFGVLLIYGTPSPSTCAVIVTGLVHSASAETVVRDCCLMTRTMSSIRNAPSDPPGDHDERPPH